MAPTLSAHDTAWRVSARADDDGGNGEQDGDPAFPFPGTIVTDGTTTIITSTSTTTTAATSSSSSTSSSSPVATSTSQVDHDDVKIGRDEAKKAQQTGNTVIHAPLTFIHIFSLAFLILVLVSDVPA